MEGDNNSIQRSHTVELVLDDMRERIILGQYQAGQPLAETALAGMYGVSRGSIRVAIQTLEKEGLIIVLDNGRKIPVSMTRKFIHDVYGVRLMIEREAVRLCMEHPVMDGAFLTTAFSDFYNLYTCREQELYLQRSIKNTNFHRAIIKTSGNGSLLQCWNTIEPLMKCITKFNCTILKEKESNEVLIETHRTLMDKIFKKDADVYDVVRDHINIAIEETLQGLYQSSVL